jgi:hypothetical protein
VACGTERWPVKVGTDRDASKVATEPQQTTIANLVVINPPARPGSRRASRFAPAELTTYQINGILSVIKKEADEDYHLIIADAADRVLTMIVESPAPGCAAGSAFSDNIAAVRQTLDQRFGEFARLEPNIPVTVTGVAFFDVLHGQEGVAKNGIELHPILAITFK